MIKLLIARGADVDARGAVRNWERKVIKEPRPKDMNQGGFTPLLYAAREGCIECAKELVGRRRRSRSAGPASRHAARSWRS